jgi:hypothetical protein
MQRGTALWERARTAARRWFTESRAKADARRDEALRRLGVDMLNEPIPEKLRQALDGKRGEAEVKPKHRR